MKARLFAAVLGAGLGLFSHTTSMAHDIPGALGTLQDLFNGCISANTMYVDRFIKSSELSANKKYKVGSANDNDGVDECSDFSWFERPLFNRPNNNIWSWFGGPNLNTSAWDCEHSTLQYGVFRKLTGQAWELVALGFIYGKLEGSTCTYSHSAAAMPISHTHTESPHTGNPPWISVSGGTTWGGTMEVGRIRVALSSWAHNDPAFAHPGNLCNTLDCYFSSYLSAW